jgi:hypothetical protein
MIGGRLNLLFHRIGTAVAHVGVPGVVVDNIDTVSLGLLSCNGGPGWSRSIGLLTRSARYGAQQDT